MAVLKQIIGWILLPFKLVFELLDPVLRFIEMAINIPLAFILGNLVDLINVIPSIWHIHIGELILGIISGVGFGLLHFFVFHFPIHTALIILICFGVAIVGYFVSYLFFKFVVDFITSVVSLVIVFIRVAIYLPGSIWLTLIKITVPTALWSLLFFLKLSFWTSDAKMITIAILLYFGILIVCSAIILGIRQDAKFYNVGILGEAPPEELKAFTHSIGVYIMTLGSIPVYIGRAIEFNNGGFRKRARDYQRLANSHSSGTWIQNHLDELNIYFIELGHTAEDVDFVVEAEESLISNIYTKLNKVDASINYVVNILGYLIGAATSGILLYIFLGLVPLSIALMAYAVVVLIVCIIFYFLENDRKWGIYHG